MQIEGHRLGLRPSALLARSEQDRPAVDHEHGVVRVDRVGVAGDLGNAGDDLGPGFRQ